MNNQLLLWNCLTVQFTLELFLVYAFAVRRHNTAEGIFGNGYCCKQLMSLLDVQNMVVNGSAEGEKAYIVRE